MATLLRRPGATPAKPTLKKPGLKTTLTKPAKADAGFSGPKLGKARAGGTWDKAEQAKKDQEARANMPWKASIPVGAVGVQAYFLDRGEPFSDYEHNIGGSKNKPGKTFPCIKDTNEPCPGCATDPKGDGYFVIRLSAVIPKITVIDKQGDKKTYHFQKKEWNVKTKMSGKYRRLWEKHGTFRGMVVSVSRDAKLDPATGNDVEFVRMLTEAEIKKFAANPEFKDKKLDEPFDFAKLYAKPSAADLKKRLGATGEAAGASDFSDDGDFSDAAGEWGSDGDD